MTDVRPRFAAGAAVTEAQRLLDHDAPEEAAVLLAGTTAAATDDELEIWQGLTLLAEGLTQTMRRDPAAIVSLQRGADLLDAHDGAPPHALDVAGLTGWARHLVAALGDPAAPTFPDHPSVPRLRLP
ncbi:DUF309 domain-containing protein [Rhodococcus sp. NPDC003318]|uniref:DUF309 domain-containing protein n=1 Tax=Rhodococcus sp. NPDC003318 TaxID=3364503 RepID=UPI00367DD333